MKNQFNVLLMEAFTFLFYVQIVTKGNWWDNLIEVLVGKTDIAIRTTIACFCRQKFGSQCIGETQIDDPLRNEVVSNLNLCEGRILKKKEPAGRIRILKCVQARAAVEVTVCLQYHSRPQFNIACAFIVSYKENLSW